MANPFAPLDAVSPDDAWQPWRPEERQPWDLRWAGHLVRRAGFGATLDELHSAVKAGPDATLDRLLHGPPDLAALDTLLTHTGESIVRGGEDAGNRLRGWWLYAMLFGIHPLREKLTLFWHGHFATSNAKVRSVPLMFRQNQTLRRHALGRFGPMLAEVSRDPAMLIWLDSNRNVKGQPNENYAREVMELFTLGVGRYTEHDIREAARAFTGWHTDGARFTYAARFHDDGPKTLLGRTGPWDGGDVQRILLEQPAAALFLVRKLYRFLISETADPPDALLEPLAERYRRQDYDTGDLVATMLRSRLFFSDHAYRQRIKSPVEYVVGLARAARPGVTPGELVAPLETMGQSLFAPPNVKGWYGGKHWLNSATILARQNFAQTTVGPAPKPKNDPKSTPPPASPDQAGDVAPERPTVTLPPSRGHTVIDLLRREKMTDPVAVADLLGELFLQGDVAPAARAKLIAFLADGSPKGSAFEDRVREAAHAVVTSPEYTLA